MEFSAQNRSQLFEKMRETPLDFLVIGGGITGAGVALHAAAAGYRTGLVEMQDFAAGTSSRSTKLVHGGLRYLKQFEVEMVADVARERAILHQNAPHIVKPQMMLLPVYDEKEASFSDFSAPVALELYDQLAEVAPEYHHFFVTKEEVQRKEPALSSDHLLKGGIYLDYTNDDARLTMEILKKAAELGALPVNYAKAIDFVYNEEGMVVGVNVQDRLTGLMYSIQSSILINAAGPWSDEVRSLGRETVSNRMYPTKGVHFVVGQDRLPVRRPIYMDTGLGDQRMLFFIPRKGKTYFGTTDTPYEGKLEHPEVTAEDVDYLLEAVNKRFPEAHLTVEDIESSWAGIRPLISDKEASDPSAISRTHDVFVSNQRLVTIAGGKLTDYRIMAEDTIAFAEDVMRQNGLQTFERIQTQSLPVSGGELPEGTSFEEFLQQAIRKGMQFGLTAEQAEAIAQWYGTNAETVFQKMKGPYSKDLPLEIALALEYSLTDEMAVSPVDFFLRRTDVLLFEPEQMDRLKDPVLQWMERRLSWSEEETAHWSALLDRVVKEAKLDRFKK